MRKRLRGGSHGRIQVSTMSKILTTKVSDSQKTLISDVHAGCLCIGCMYMRAGCVYGECTCGLTVYMERGVDKIMDIFVRAGAKLLDDEAGSRSAFYGLRSITETLVWLHYCLDGYYCLLCCECLGNSWYVFYDVAQFG
jgi:hypothetical protein